MAIIGKIREKSTLVLIIIGGAIMAFVLTDLFSSVGTGQQGPINITEVNESVIDPQEFDLRVNKAYDSYREQTRQELDERTKSTIREQVWSEMVSDIILGKEMKELGVNVTTKELFDLIQGNPPHPQVRQAFANPQTGEYDPAVVVNFIKTLDQNEPNVKTQWVDFERGLKRSHTFDKYYNLIRKGLYYPSELAKKVNQDNRTAISFQYAYKPYNSIADSTISVSEDEKEEYYQEHLSEFEQEPSIRLSYAYFPVVPSEVDMEEAEQWAQGTFEKFQNAANDSTFVEANSDNRFNPIFVSADNLPSNVDTSLLANELGYVSAPKLVNNVYYISKLIAKKMAPDSVKASHILIRTNERPLKEAKQLADSLEQLLENGADLGTLALEFSEDEVSKKDSGNVGWFMEGRMVKPFSDSAFAAEPGEIKRTRSQFGIHLLEVKERTAVKEKYQIGIVVREVLPSKETYADVFNEANSFSINASDLESFDAEIENKNIQKRSAVIQENDNLIRGLNASRDLVRWARDGEEDQVSEAYDVDEGFAVAVIEAVSEEGPAPLEKVEARVEFLVRQQKKGEQIAEEMAGYSSLGEIAGALSIAVENAEQITFVSPGIPNVGLEPKLVGKAIALENDQMSEPIIGDNGVFVIKINEKVLPGDINIAQVREVYKSELSSRMNNGAIFNALKEKANLIDNRSKFY